MESENFTNCVRNLGLKIQESTSEYELLLEIDERNYSLILLLIMIGRGQSGKYIVS